MLWPETTDARARDLLNSAVHSIRKVIGESTLVTGVDGIHLDTSMLWIDVIAFEGAIQRGDASEAVALYGGPLLDGLSVPEAHNFEHWTDIERDKIELLYNAALERTAETAWQNGDSTLAISLLRKLLSRTPTDERTAVRLMTLLVADGDRAAALSVARKQERVLREEFDADPNSAVRSLANQLLRIEGAVPHRSSPEVETPSSAMTNSTRTSTRRQRILWASPAVLTLLLTLGFWQFGNRPAAAKRLAILPFANLTPNDADAHFVAAMHQQLISHIDGIDGLTVMAPYTSRQLDGIAPDDVARTIDVDYVLSGSAGRDRQRVYITLRLIETKTNSVVWSEPYEQPASDGDILQTQSRIAAALAEALELRLRGSVRRRHSQPVTNAAFQWYNEAIGLPSGRDREGNAAAAEILKRALGFNSDFPEALAALSQVYRARSYSFGQPREWADSALHLARRATQLDPNLAAGWDAVGYALLDLGRLNQAREAYQRVLRLNPSAGEARIALGWISFLKGDLVSAVSDWMDAAKVDPLNPTIRGNMALLEILLRDYEQARYWQESRRRLSRSDDFGFSGPTRLLLAEGKISAARVEADRQLSKTPGAFRARRNLAVVAIHQRDYSTALHHYEELVRDAPNDWDNWGTTYRSSYAFVLKELGQNSRADSVLTMILHEGLDLLREGDKRAGVQREIAAVYAARADKRKALRYLKAAVDAGWIHESIEPSFLWNELADDPEFKGLMRTIDSRIDRERARVRREFPNDDCLIDRMGATNSYKCN